MVRTLPKNALASLDGAPSFLGVLRPNWRLHYCIGLETDLTQIKSLKIQRVERIYLGQPKTEAAVETRHLQAFDEVPRTLCQRPLEGAGVDSRASLLQKNDARLFSKSRWVNFDSLTRKLCGNQRFASFIQGFQKVQDFGRRPDLEMLQGVPAFDVC